MQKVIDVEHAVVFGNMSSEAFNRTPEWRKARYYALKTHGNRCQLCGADPTKSHLHVDHVMPRHLYPERCLDFNNLQVLCEACHSAKGPVQVDDYRGSYTKIDPSKMKDFIRVTRRHLVLEIRHPKTRVERDFLGEDMLCNNKEYV
jgi:hypothetical protein